MTETYAATTTAASTDRSPTGRPTSTTPTRRYNPRAPEIWAELREAGCPVAHTDRYGGMWAPITAELVREVAYDTEHFTSRVGRRQHVDHRRRGADRRRPADHQRPAVPRPRPAAAAAAVRAEADRAVGAGDPPALPPAPRRHGRRSTPGETVVDAAVQYAQHIPVNVIARMLGFPLEDDDLFREFVHDALEGVNRAPEVRQAGFERARRLPRRPDRAPPRRAARRPHVVPARRRARRPEAVAASTSAARSCCCCIAGIDTTWSAIGSSLWHLATHPDDRRRLVAEPELMPTAIEELLRAYAPGHDGPHGRQGPRLPRLPDEGRRVGAAAVPGGQPRPGRCSTAPTRSSSTGWRTATPRSASASTAASAPTWPGSSCASPSRSSSPASRSSSSPTRTPWRGASVRSAVRAACPCAIL